MSRQSARAVRAIAIPAFLLLGLFLGWDYYNHPGRYHDFGVRAKMVPLQPDASLPTFRSVQTPLAGVARNEAPGGSMPPKPQR